VRGVQVHGQKQTRVTAGHRTAVNLSGVDVQDVSRGQNLISPGAFEPTRVADAIVDVLPTARPLKHGQRVRFHQGTDEILGRVSLVGPDATTIDSGARAYVRLRLEARAVLGRGDRYILRAYSPPITIAGGVILDPHPPRSAIRTAAARDRLRRVEVDPIAAMIVDTGGLGLSTAALVSRAGIDPREVEPRIAALVAAKQAERAGSRLVAPDVLGRARDAVVAALTDLHKGSPLSEGMPRDELRGRVLRRGSVEVFDRALEDLERSGAIVVRDRVALATHRVALSPEEERVRETIERAYRAGGLKPPEPGAIAAEAGVASAVADRVLKLLQRQKVLVRVDTLLFHDEALKQLKAEVTALKAAAGPGARIDVATFKERFGVSRKFAIPLLEYLDRERVTRRMGDARVIL
jgi:selenocysteine-specific elongation factor